MNQKSWRDQMSLNTSLLGDQDFLSFFQIYFFYWRVRHQYLLYPHSVHSEYQKWLPWRHNNNGASNDLSPSTLEFSQDRSSFQECSPRNFQIKGYRNPTYWPGTRLYLLPTWTQCQVAHKLKTHWNVQMSLLLCVKGGREHSKLTALMSVHNPTHCDHNTVNISAKLWAKEQQEIPLKLATCVYLLSCSPDCQLFIILSFYT